MGFYIASSHLPKEEPPHLHEFIELVYILNGRGVHGIDGVEYNVSRGSLLFINYRQVHYFKSDDQMEICNILLDPKWISENLIDSENAFELLSLSAFSFFQQEIDTNMALIRFDGASRTKVERIIAEMKEEREKKNVGYETVLKSLTSILLTMVFRKMSKGSRREGWKLTPDFLEYIRSRCTEKLTLPDLAKECFYNPAYFSRLFKEHYGMTVTDFISQSRLEKAIELLQCTSLSAEEISEKVGFSNKAVFYRLLKDKTGCTPSDYRKKVKNNYESM